MCLILCLLLPAIAQADNWPRFRGPSAAGVTEATDLPKVWSDSENLRWKVDLPGPGSSSPVIWGDRLYLTCYTGYGQSEEDPGDKQDLQRHLLCFDVEEGTLRWDRHLPGRPEHTEDYAGFIALHGFTSSTPAVDESGVYVFYGTGGAAGYDHEGNLKWHTLLGDKTHEFGTANSPVLHEDVVIVNAAVESGTLYGLDKRTGETLWQVDDVERSWNTPILVSTEQDGQQGQELVLNDNHAVRGFHPQTGEELWRVDAANRLVCPSLIAADGVIYAVGAREDKTIAIKAGGRGNVTETHLLWELDKSAHVSSPAYHQGRLYWVSESNGIAYCADAQTGELIYQDRIRPRPDKIYASPIIAGGHLYYVSRQAGTYVVPLGPQFKVTAHNRIADDESVFDASPAVRGNHLYLRSDQALYCIGE